MKEKIIKKTNNLLKIMLSLLIVFTSINFNIKNSFADNASSKDDYPKNSTVTYNGKISYGSNIVGDFKLNGRQAFCMEHPKATPSDGTKISQKIYSDNNIRKVMFYGWGGPEQWSGFENRAHGIVVTSLALSYYYYGDNSSPNTIKDFMAYIKSKTVPNYTIKFSDSNVDAYKSGNIQKTKTMTLESGSTTFGATIKLLNDMTYVDETHGTRQTGGSVTIKGKTKFHFEAPLTVNLGTWKSGNVTSEYSFSPIVAISTTSNVQDVGSWDYIKDPNIITNLQINWLSLGDLKIAKKDNKNNYVPNTQFKISYNADMSSAIGTYTTTNDGSVTINDLTPQTVYIQEMSVPNHLVLDNTVHSIEVKNGETVTFTQINNWKQGYIQITKKDKKTNQIVKKSGTEFEILSGNTVIATVVTNDNGIAKSGLLDYGTYIVREKKAPQNYTIATLTQNQGVTENNKVYDITIYNEPVLGEIELLKQDKEIGNSAQGDATLVGAEYVIKANQPIYNPSDNSVIFSKDEIISSKNIGNGIWGDVGTKQTDSSLKVKWSNLPMGEYRIEEINPSNGYLLDNNHIVSLTSTNQTEKIISKKVTSQEQVIKGKLEVAKSGNDGSSGVIQGLKDVEFTMKLYSEVQRVGWNNAKTYSTILTDETGRGKSIDVPFGWYQVKETKTPPNFMAGGDFFVNIDKDKEVEYRMVNNAPFKAWLKIIKQDEIGNNVTLSNATFKIRDKDGNYIRQKVGLFYKDEWSTNDKGIAILDNMLLQGEYTIDEIRTPQGFLLGNDIKVNISSDNADITFDDDNEPIITVKFINEKPTGKIVLNKTTEIENDVKNKGIKFKLTANSDIIDATNGKIIYKKGDIVTLHNDNGIYEINEHGKLEINNLPLGNDKASYKLEEVETLDGYKLLDEPIVIDFEIKDDFTKEYTVIKEAENNLTETLFSKIDSIYLQELPGAHMRLVDEKGDIKEEWISTVKPHLVKGLIYGKTYTLFEDISPQGYVIANSITFTYSKDIEKITMKDKTVDIKKLDVNNNYVVGAILQVVDTKTKNIVDKWETSDKKHYINNLIVGHTYRIEEVETPKGFTTAKPIEFIVNEDENQHINMIDTQVEIIKIDEIENNVKGALLQVVDIKTNEVIDKWLTDGTSHKLENAIVGQFYRLEEVKTPKGYISAKPIEFTVNGSNNQQIKMVDKRILTNIEVNKVDSITLNAIVNEDFEFTMYADPQCTIVLDVVNADKNRGTATFYDVPRSIVYIKETSAPKGYKLSDEVKKIVIDEELENYGKVHSFVYKNTLLPVLYVATDDNTQVLALCITGGIACCVILISRRKKKEEYEK